jgi:hypothetical protein
MLLVWTGVPFSECKQTLVCRPAYTVTELRRAAGQVGKHAYVSVAPQAECTTTAAVRASHRVV